MKPVKPQTLALFLILILIPGLAMAGTDNPWQRKLPFKSAVINYVVEGMEKGSETLYIRNYGLEQAQYRKTSTTMFGMTNRNETVEFTTPDWIYSFDLVEKTGSKTANPVKFMIQEYDKLSRSEKKTVLKNIEKMGTAMTMGLQGEIQPNAAKILGYKCDKVTAMGTTIFTIHDTNICLKTQGQMMGVSFSTKATSLDKKRVDDSYFKHPAGITPIHETRADEMARAMARQTMESLKDPNYDPSKARAAQQQEMRQQALQQGADPEMTEADQENMKKAMEMMKNIYKQE